MLSCLPLDDEASASFRRLHRGADDIRAKSPTPVPRSSTSWSSALRPSAVVPLTQVEWRSSDNGRPWTAAPGHGSQLPTELS